MHGGKKLISMNLSSWQWLYSSSTERGLARSNTRGSSTCWIRWLPGASLQRVAAVPGGSIGWHEGAVPTFLRWTTTSFRFGPSAHGTLRTSQAEHMKGSKRGLKFAGLRPRTLRAYRTALDRFLNHVKRRRLDIAKPHRLDRQLAEFIDLSYQEGEPMSYSGHLLSAIKRFHPELSHGQANTTATGSAATGRCEPFRLIGS